MMEKGRYQGPGWMTGAALAGAAAGRLADGHHRSQFSSTMATGTASLAPQS